MEEALKAGMNAYAADDKRPILGVLRESVGCAYWTARGRGREPTDAVSDIIWTLFYFYQQENQITPTIKQMVMDDMDMAARSYRYCFGEPGHGDPDGEDAQTDSDDTQEDDE